MGSSGASVARPVGANASVAGWPEFGFEAGNSMRRGATCQHHGPVESAPSGQGRDAGLLHTAVRGIGETLLTAGLIVLLFVVYEVFVTDLLNGQRQDALSRELRAEWAGDPPSGSPGLDLTPVPTEVPLGTGFAF